jgi:hypothetical protein
VPTHSTTGQTQRSLTSGKNLADGRTDNIDCPQNPVTPPRPYIFFFLSREYIYIRYIIYIYNASKFGRGVRHSVHPKHFIEYPLPLPRWANIYIYIYIYIFAQRGKRQGAIQVRKTWSIRIKRLYKKIL